MGTRAQILSTPVEDGRGDFSSVISAWGRQRQRGSVDLIGQLVQPDRWLKLVIVSQKQWTMSLGRHAALIFVPTAHAQGNTMKEKGTCCPEVGQPLLGLRTLPPLCFAQGPPKG